MARKSEGPKGCLFYRHSLALIESLDDREAGRAVKAAAAYFLYGEVPGGLGGREELVCKVMCCDVDDSLERYQEACARNRASRRRSSLLPPGEYYVLPDDPAD
ncbi:MAG: hypothetical protein IKX47_02085 [Oscillospiraceae bacterium]|nr:hypothetical protein [Oscillospiraceae bacterium]